MQMTDKFDFTLVLIINLKAIGKTIFNIFCSIYHVDVSLISVYLLLNELLVKSFYLPCYHYMEIFIVISEEL